jgi:ADP-heptose:LPS heptosyltransferase
VQIQHNDITGKLDYSSISRVLIVRLGKIGDIVTTSFVFEILKSNYPEIDICLLTLRSNKEVLEYNPNLKRVYYSNNNIKLFWNLLKLKFSGIDVLMDFNDNASTTSSLIFRFLNAKWKAGYNFPKYRDVLNIKVNPLKKDESHIIDRMKNFLLQTGMPVNDDKVKPYFYLNPSILSQIKKELGSSGKIVAVNLSAGAKIRYWDKDNWVNLLNLILKEYPSFRLLLLSAPSDKALRQEIHSKLLRTICPADEQQSIQHFGSFIRLSDILISADTSAIHIASAFGTPVVAMYPCYHDNFVSWQPYKTPHRSIKSSSESIQLISVEEVFNEFKDLVNEIKL